MVFERLFNGSHTLFVKTNKTQCYTCDSKILVKTGTGKSNIFVLSYQLYQYQYQPWYRGSESIPFGPGHLLNKLMYIS